MKAECLNNWTQQRLKDIKAGQILSYRHYSSYADYFEYFFCKIFEPVISNYTGRIYGFYGKLFCPGRKEIINDVQFIDTDYLYPFEEAYEDLQGKFTQQLYRYQRLLNELESIHVEFKEKTNE